MRRKNEQGSIKWLRRKIVKQINAWAPHLNAIALNGDNLFPFLGEKKKKNAYRRLIFGVARDGRAFFIYPMLKRHAPVNYECAMLMQECEIRGGIAGTAVDILDAWDILFLDEKEYKRKKRTYYYRNVKPKGAKNDESE